MQYYLRQWIVSRYMNFDQHVKCLSSDNNYKPLYFCIPSQVQAVNKRGKKK